MTGQDTAFVLGLGLTGFGVALFIKWLIERVADRVGDGFLGTLIGMFTAVSLSVFAWWGLNAALYLVRG